MILGIDVGGTHTDSVLMQNGQIVRKSKVLTDKNDLLGCIMTATRAVAQPEDIRRLRRIVLSTTMTTNAVAQNQLEPVGLVVMSGPGVAHCDLPLGDKTAFIKGYMNHRGLEAEAIDEAEIQTHKNRFAEQGIRHFGVVGKFSTRSALHEQAVHALLSDSAAHITQGHQLSGELSFPRRISTAYLNEAVWQLHNTMTTQLHTYLQQLGIPVPLYILKADGGTIGLEASRHHPVQTILSGPAATIMGVLPYAPLHHDCVSIDIGGTTTDIALFAEGAPLLEPKGVKIEGHKTLVRGLLTHSLAVGGDSHVRVINGQIAIGPQRLGAAMAFDGPVPTPTDAMIVLDMAEIGDKDKAEAAIGGIAAQLENTTQEAARAILEVMCEIIAGKVQSMIAEVNSKPVYTIHEMLEGKVLVPEDAIIVGGPAPFIACVLKEKLGMNAIIPNDADVINASGAAMARTTVELSLMADTEEGVMSIAEEGIQSTISPRFTLDELIQTGRTRLTQHARAAGAPEEDIEIEVTDSQNFNVIRNGYTTGKNFRVRMQIKPGLAKGAFQPESNTP